MGHKPRLDVRLETKKILEHVGENLCYLGRQRFLRDNIKVQSTH